MTTTEQDPQTARGCKPRSRASVFRAGVAGGALFGALFPIVFLVVGSAAMTTAQQPNAGETSLDVIPIAVLFGVIVGVLTGLAAAACSVLGTVLARWLSKPTTVGAGLGAFVGAALLCWLVTDSVGGSLPVDIIFTSIAAVISFVGLAGIWLRGSALGVFRRAR